MLDTGYFGIFAQNAEALGLDWRGVDGVVLSHCHDDHTKGLSAFFTEGPKPRLVAHPALFRRVVSKGLVIGCPYPRAKLERYFDLCLTAEPLALTENLFYLGEIPRVFPDHQDQAQRQGENGPDKNEDDTALAYRGREGVYVITGCSHSGISNIVPPMLILILSWSLGGVCRQLIGTGVFISGFVETANLPLGFLPFLIFIVAAVMSFAMGSSWGTFGMLIPIVTMICASEGAGALLIPTLSATLAGSVYGDHCSPLSDTTILASTGAACEHIRHVETQFPYATLVAVLCGAGYLISGLTLNPWIALAACTALLIAAIMVLSRKD